MIRRTTNNRLGAVHGTISSQALRPAAVDEAYAELLKTGQLPNEPRLAWTALKRALHARKKASSQGSAYQRTAPDDLPPRDQVFREAVDTFDPVRNFARLLIGLLAEAGRDPSDPEFIASDTELPEFGSVAMHLFGWPHEWVKPPYERQLQRVLQQHAAVREHNDGSDAFHQAAAAGLAGFLTRGELPTDDLVRRCAITIGEMFAIHAHYFGHGDEELLAAYEAVATTSGEAHNVALSRLGALQTQATETCQ